MANKPISPPAPIAVIGIGCRLPGGANSLDKFERLLTSGGSGHGPVPPSRWNRDAFYAPADGGGGRSRASLPAREGYFLREDVSRFDARLFGYTSRDAHGADPQQRLLLQTTYMALENAGLAREALSGSKTGVYVSTFAQDYQRMGFSDLTVLEGSHVTGTGPAMLSNRISYVFDLTGPSLTLDTGCSGSLVALHKACQDLHLGESEMAIVAGSQLSLHPDQSIIMAQLGMVNPDGHCYAFDSRGKGYAKGEGVVAIVIKLLDQALADGDPVQAVIVNSGINQDGHTAGSIMSPSGDAQAALIRDVYARAGLDPGQTAYVEAHGTGTQVGDREEVGAINSEFCAGRASRTHALAVGSVKANIGHLEATAGIAGLLKAVVVLRSGVVPAQLNIKEYKPALRLHERNIRIPRKLTPLAPGPRRASVNSFGYGGTNCHVILETLESYTAHVNSNGYARTIGQGNGDQANGRPRTTNGHGRNNGHTNDHTNGSTNGHANACTSGHNNSNYNANVAQLPAHLFLLSANSELSLKLTAENLESWIASQTAAAATSKDESQVLADLAYTLSARRSMLPWRHTVVAASLAELADGAGRLKTAKPRRAAERTQRLAFVFTGQGAQWAGMGRELMRVPAFAASIHRSRACLDALGCAWSITDEMMFAAARLQEAEIAQPATTVLQIALVDLLASLEVAPASVVGHSSGEIGAAYAAGLLDHEAAVKVAFHRGLCSAQAVANGTRTGVKGSMLATGLGEADVAPYIEEANGKKKGLISVACVNSPQSTTISGDKAAIDELRTILDAANVFARKLRVDTAYHSHHMKPIAAAYQAAMGDIGPPTSHTATSVTDGSIHEAWPTFYSSVMGSRLPDGGRLGPEYWAQNLVSKVRFSEALQCLVQEKADNGFTFIELGPTAALAGPAKQTLAAVGVGKNSPAYLSALVRNTDARVSALTLVGRLIELGHAVRKNKTGPLLEEAPPSPTQQQPVHKVVTTLQPYPFDESVYWREPRLSKAHRFRPFPYHDLVGLLDPASSLQEPRWTHHLQVTALPWLRDHVVDEQVIFPASGSVCMVLEAMRQLVEMRTKAVTHAPGGAVPVPNFSVSNVVFSKAVCLPLDDDHAEIEIQLTISPSQEAGGKWETFRIVSFVQDAEGAVGEGVWEENCSGLVSCDVDLVASSASANDEPIQLGASEHELKLQNHIHKLEQIQTATATASADTLDSDAFYARLKASGNHYGPEFALLRDVRLAASSAWAKVTVPGVAVQHTHLAHPTMLDAICHMGALLFKAHCGNAPIVVGSIPDLTLLPASHDQLAMLSTPGTELLVASTFEPQDSRSCVEDVYVLHKDEQTGALTPLLKSQYILRAFGSGALNTADDEGAEGSQKTTGYDGHKAHQMVWRPDVDLPSNSKLLTKLSTVQDDRTADAQLDALELASSIFIKRALAEVKAANVDVTTGHLKKLLGWMERYVNSSAYKTRTTHIHTPEDESRAIEAAASSSEGPQGRMAARIGRVLASILAGKTDPLGVMAENNLLDKVYTEGRLMEASFAQLEAYVSLLAFKHPRMKVLEIGAGTGGATAPVLRALSSGEEDFLESYDFTDVSAQQFEQAKAKFARWTGGGGGGGPLRFGVLDIEQPLTEAQGYAAHSYDLVVAANVLHETRDLHTALGNVRRLLKPGTGCLVLLELARPTAWATMVLGTLRGWWAFEDTHLRGDDGPLLAPEKWDEALRKTGFSGLDVVAQGAGTPGRGVVSVMVTTACEVERRMSDPEWVAVSDQGKQLDRVRIIEGFSGSPAIRSVADGLRVASVQKGHQSWIPCGLESPSTRTSIGDECVVVLDAADNSMLLSQDPGVFERVKQCLTTGTKVLWVALQDRNRHRNDEAEDARTKGYRAMIQGVARVLRRENGPTFRLVTVDVHETTDLGNQAVVGEICRQLVEVAEASFVPQVSSSTPAPSDADENYEREYALCDGQILIPRLQKDEKFLAWSESRQAARSDNRTAPGSAATAKIEKDVAFHQPSRPLKLHVAVPGLLSSLRFVDDEPTGALKPWEIRVSSRAHGINFKDILVALGQMKAGVTMVGELAGIVTHVGAEMAHRFAVGDRVMGFGAPSHFASDPVLSGHLAHAVPANLTLAQAASIPVVYATAHYCLFQAAHFRKGRTMLVTAASGGVGQAAIQLARHAGADTAKGDIIAVVGSAAKRRLVVETYGIPETHVLSSRSRGADLRDAVLRLTGGWGVDFVLNSLAGDMLTAGFQCLARLGAFVEIGKTDIYRGSHIQMGPLDRSVTFASVDLIVIAQERPDIVYETLGAVADLLAKGAVRPPSPVTELPISKMDEAFRMIASRKHTGKVVLVSEPGATVTAVAPRPAPFQLDGKGTYVIAGGLGDLGRKLAGFLASSGAGHIILLSRRGISAEDRTSLEKTIEQANTRGRTRLHIVKCDILEAADLQSCVDYCRKQSLLPVRGVVHGGMVLRDRPFMKMSHEDFTAVLRPKVDGTVNLDRAFASPDLDFFITLSSTTTLVGNASQANYVAGNSFQDAFARARSAHSARKTGSKTHYISLNLGGITGSALVAGAKQSNRLSSMFMSVEEMLTSLEYAMSPAGARRDGCSQSVLGLCRKTLEDADDAVSLSNPLLSRLPYQRHNNSTGDSAATKKVDIEQAVRSAATVAAAQVVIQEAMVAKCAVFLDRPVDEVPIDAPLATIGLDSLVSIELKNWILRAFQAALQTSEISSALSMASLAATVASRSKLIGAETRAASSSSENADLSSGGGVHGGDGTAAKASGIVALPAHGFACCKAAKTLPRYPLPDLDATLKSLVDNVSHFATSAEELEGLHQAVADFGTPGSLGRSLYDQLAKRAADPTLDSWLADLHLKGLYLTRRHPLAPWGNFLSTHRDTARPHGQAERAAIIAREAFGFMLEVEKGTLEPDWIGTQPLCSDKWQWMFNAVREPRPGCDEMRRYPGVENQYCAVLRRGHIFTVPLQHGDGQPVAQGDLRAAFQEIIDQALQGPDSWAGLLTTDGRDPWAANRATLLSLSPGPRSDNEAYIQTVERAAFVVCLDMGSPETAEERVRQAYLGDGFNRWFDKSTQFIVAANGRSAQLTEHSMVDGLTILRLTERIHDAIQAHVPDTGSNGTGAATNGGAQRNGKASARPVEITRLAPLQTTPSINADILKLRAIYAQATAERTYVLQTVPSQGIATARPKAGLHAKACVDAAIMLANYFHFAGSGSGTLPGCWEPVSTQHFHKGRPEIVQMVTGAVVNFCAAAAACEGDEGAQPQQLLQQRRVAAQQLLRTAVEGWEHSVREAAQGHGFLRLWDTLQGMLPANLPEKDKPALFTDPVFWRAFPGKVFQGRNEGEIEDAAICVYEKDGLWMSYSIKEHRAVVSIIGGNGRVEEYQKCLDWAGRIVRDIVRA